MLKPMTLPEWLRAQLEQLDSPVYIAGYQAGYMDGLHRAFEATLAAVAPPIVASAGKPASEAAPAPAAPAEQTS